MTEPPALELRCIIRCPHCGHEEAEIMPTESCTIVYDCRGCGARIIPKPDSCCVFCSFGNVRCPPVQEGRSC